MFDKLRKMVEERMNPRPQALPMQRAARPMLPTNAQAAPAKLQPKQPIGQWRAPEAQQPYTQDNVRTNSLVDAGQLPESSREGKLRVMAHTMTGDSTQGNFLQPVSYDNGQVTQNSGFLQGSPIRYEDDISAGHYAQPVSYDSGQTTLNSRFFQDPRRKLGNF